MVASNIAPLEFLDNKNIAKVLQSSSPCITLFLQPYRPGEHMPPIAELLRTDLRRIVKQLETMKTARTDIEILRL